jgi:hypothetical protein
MKILRDLAKERVEDAAGLKEGDSRRVAPLRKREQLRVCREDEILRLVGNLRFDEPFLADIEELMRVITPGFTPRPQKGRPSLSEKVVTLFFEYYQFCGLTSRQQQLL